MNNFDWGKFTKRIAVTANLATVYNAWTIADELEKWFLRKALFYTEKGDLLTVNTNAVAGSVYEWQWFSQEAAERGTIKSANGKDFLQFTFAGDCIVEVSLSSKKDFTIVELTQKEIPLDDVSKIHIRLGCAFGWAFYLTNLKSILEGGIDLRNKDREITGVVND
jgi:uncharacterized protein YndB with AHSA1/START domain